jgi:hypothetical protein
MDFDPPDLIGGAGKLCVRVHQRERQQSQNR